MRLLAFVFGVLAGACMGRAVLAIVTGHILQGLLLLVVGVLLAGGAGYFWDDVRR